ncbi:MAG: HDOD domain-containing protein [Acidobacteria bacterium]|nr:HDOD domain-containing protein [Acidobacteriota bacterium]
MARFYPPARGGFVRPVRRSRVRPGGVPAPAGRTIGLSVTNHLRGRLEVFGFADLLQWMELNHRSGRLTLSQGRDRRLLDWRGGEIVYVSGSIPRHRLGVHLLRSGALPAATLYDLLARNFTSDKNLTRLILEGGHDTHDGLSLRVEELARKLLFEMFDWNEAQFEYDPEHRVQPILRIGLTLRGQALAFQGVKNLDDSHRRRPRRKSVRDEAEIWDSPFEPKESEERFWDLLERTESTVSPEEARKLARAFREFVDRLRALSQRAVAMRPIFEDTAVMLSELLRKSPVDPTAVIPVAALDPYLSLDLLILANALSVDRDNAVGTVPDAVERLGGRAVTVLIDRLTAVDFDRIPDSDGAARALRRASVSAAVAAGRYAERYGTTRERAYTLGLLHTVCYAEIFELFRLMDFPAGAFRGVTLDAYRTALGVRLAETWSLPPDFQSVISDDGSDPSEAASLVRTARATVPACAIGQLGHEPVDPLLTEEIAAEVNMVFQFLGLPPLEGKQARRR